MTSKRRKHEPATASHPLATGDIRDLKGIIPVPSNPVSGKAMNRAVARRGSRGGASDPR
jgi:hypothetical protein